MLIAEELFLLLRRDDGKPESAMAQRAYGLAAAVRREASAVLGRDLPTVLGHDGGALALAESWRGATQDALASLSIVVSTGEG